MRFLKDAGVALKLKKCAFFTDAVEHLGNVIKPGKIEISNHTKIFIVG